jgi:cytochrome c556
MGQTMKITIDFDAIGRAIAKRFAAIDAWADGPQPPRALTWSGQATVASDQHLHFHAEGAKLASDLIARFNDRPPSPTNTPEDAPSNLLGEPKPDVKETTMSFKEDAENIVGRAEKIGEGIAAAASEAATADFNAAKAIYEGTISKLEAEVAALTPPVG